MFIRCMVALGGILLVLSVRPALAQSSADALFHEAARQYVAGEAEAARQTVERGLEVAPSDPRLQALQQKLEEQSSRRQGGDQSGPSGQSNPQSNDASGDGQQRDDGSENDSPDNRSPSNPGAQSPPSSERAQSPAQEERQTSSQPESQRERGAQEVQGLNRAQANRLLQALEAQEKQLLREVRVRNLEEQSVEKDW